MERTKWPATGGLVLSTIYLSRNVPTSFAFDKPLLSAIIFLTTIGVSLIGLGRYLPKDAGQIEQARQYRALPLDEVGQPHPSRAPSPGLDDVRYASSPRKLRIAFVVLVVTILLRVEVLLRVLGNVQCSSLTWEPIIPFVFACYEYWSVQRHLNPSEHDDSKSGVVGKLENRIAHAQYRYLIAVGLMTVGGLVAIATTRSSGSTYICAASLSFHWLTPLLQRVGTILDIIIAYSLSQLLQHQEGSGSRGIALRYSSVGWAFLYAAQFSALVLVVSGTVYYTALATSNQKKRVFEIPAFYVWSVLKLDIALTTAIMCALLMVLHVGLTTVTLIPTFVSICTATTSYAWNNTFSYPPTNFGLGFCAICFAILGFAMFFHFEANTDDNDHDSGRKMFKRVPSWFYAMLLLLFCVRTGLWVTGNTSVNYHPIDLLIYDAQSTHERYVNQSSSSKTLAEAVDTYRERYKRHPPPGFDLWYNYAIERDSVIIDDFDSIYNDLLPFYAMSPQEIRERTWQMISNPWHDAAGLSIRNHRQEISPNVKPTHRWMLDGTIGMIRPFEEWLPDMDLAFNINDECRIAVPYAKDEQMRQVGRDGGALEGKPGNAFSTGRAEQWKAVSEEPNDAALLDEYSSQRTFDLYGSIGCPPGSPARIKRPWDVQRLCTACVEPHSIGGFIANWSLAGDICHQPDMATLHGLYTSPAAFKASHDLYPIFSQSKARGFNDILYPSAWNYIDKAKYDPREEFPDVEFAHKNNTIFWRGATSEGLTTGLGQWKGMARQRFVRQAADIDLAAPQSILVPFQASDTQQRLSYTPVSVHKLRSLVSTDLHFVDEIVRCKDPDCPQQTLEFAPLASPTDFQTHWQYKFLLDLDGAGFSGRFLPFLQSHSLPFKAALFREWWDDRITAWQHFVPLDLRGHGFWATLAYCAGFEGKINGKDVKLEPHGKEAERIAENGREWANKVLRKEDMEIYVFRLLLEWARLTDDKRDSIGFTIDAG